MLNFLIFMNFALLAAGLYLSLSLRKLKRKRVSGGFYYDDGNDGGDYSGGD